MKATRTISSALLLVTLGSLLSAQDAKGTPAKKQDPAKPVVKEATAKPDSARELSFSVMGLTNDNMMKAKEGLQALTHHVFACSACSVEESVAGNCPKCSGALAPEDHAIFAGIKPSAEASTIAITLEPKATLRFSELEGALSKNSIKIDSAKFTLPGRARLIVRGATAETVPAVEKALTEAKLFEEVKTRFDATSKELVIMVHAGATAPTRAKVTAAIEGAKAQLADIVWGPPPMKSKS
jgi:hypothetical protein